MARKAWYGVYDLKNNELPVTIDYVEAIAKLFNTSVGVIYCRVTRKSLIKNRYIIKRLDI